VDQAVPKAQGCAWRDVLAAVEAVWTAVTGELLVITDGAVSLNRAQVSVDVEDFLTQATAALDADRAKEPNATALLMAAITAQTGNFLEDDPDQQWAAALAEEVRATHIALLRVLATRLREAGDTDTVVRYTLRLLEQDGFGRSPGSWLTDRCQPEAQQSAPRLTRTCQASGCGHPPGKRAWDERKRWLPAHPAVQERPFPSEK
jgi:hypothetical protein